VTAAPMPIKSAIQNLEAPAQGSLDNGKPDKFHSAFNIGPLGGAIRYGENTDELAKDFLFVRNKVTTYLFAKPRVCSPPE
jgi:hypothetical protein